MSLFIQITVQRGKEQHDLEVSPETTIADLIEAVVQTYGWALNATGEPLDYKIQHIFEDRSLKPSETMLEARVWNGALLVFNSSPRTQTQPKMVQPISAMPKQEMPQTTHLNIQRSVGEIIDINSQPGDVSSEEESAKFSWKQLD